MERRHYKSSRGNVVKIFRFLKEMWEQDRGHVTVGEISRGTGLHKWVVSRTLDIWMAPVVDVVVPEELENIGLKVKFVKLKNPEVSEEQVLRGLDIKL